MMPWREYMDRVRSQMLEDIGMPKMRYVSSGRAGDIAKCVNGHELYRLVHDVVAQAVVYPPSFDPIGDAPKPVPREKIGPCHICGMPWLVPNPSGGYAFCNLGRKFEP
jgi:hypothetical protein